MLKFSSSIVLEFMAVILQSPTANPPGAAGFSAESRLAARHVPTIAGQLSGQRLPGGQGEGSCHWEPPQTPPERGHSRPPGAGKDSRHHQQSAGAVPPQHYRPLVPPTSSYLMSLTVSFAFCSLCVNISFDRICHPGPLLMSWTRPGLAVLYQGGALQVGVDR